MTGVAYVVYRQAYEGTKPLRTQFERDLGSRVALRAFADRAAADAHVAGLMHVARRTANPFRVLEREAYERLHEPEGGYDSYDAIDRAALARLLALGVAWRAEPKAGWQSEDWQAWYDHEAPHLADGERAKVWSLFDPRPLFGVYEVALGDCGGDE